MKLYQAGYFRIGGHGSGSGWNLVAPSVGMSEIAKAGFRGIAARLVDLKQTAQTPPEAMGIFCHERFVYLMHVNYAASGADSRGVAYVHGYCFHLAEYYELATHPEILFGVLKESFDMEYQPQITAYPVRESLDYRNMNERRLLDQYHLSKEQYRSLILGAICALEGYDSPMCVKYSKAREQNLQTYQDIMFLIMKGLPYHLRQKLLSFSWHGMQASICFSDQVQGTNYADLDRGIFQCSDARLKAYSFIKLYNMEVFYDRKDMREQIFQNIALFIQEAYAEPLKDAGCPLIEAGFQKQIKKNEGGIEPEAVMPLLQDFFKHNMIYGRETAEYLTALLDAVNQGGIFIEDQNLAAQISAAYKQYADGALLEPVALLEARAIVRQSGAQRQRESGFARLLELKQRHPEHLYPAVCQYLEQLDADYFSDYFWNRFLPGELTSLKKAERFFNKNGQTFSAKEHRFFQKLLKELTEHELKEAGSFEEMCAAAQVTDRIRQHTPREESYQKLWQDTCRTMWSFFQIDWFETGSVHSYEQYEVKKQSSPNAKKVCRMISLLEDARQCTDVNKLWNLLYDTASAVDKKYRLMIRRGMREEFFAGTKQLDVRQLDRSLVFFYDPDKNQTDLVKWISQWAKQQDLDSYSSIFADYGRQSELLADETRKKNVQHYLAEAFKNRKQTAYNNLPQSCKKALQMVYQSLEQKTGSTAAAPWIIESLYKETLGLFVLLTLGVCGICLHRYGSGELWISMTFVIFAAVGLVLSLIIQTVTGKGPRQQAAVMGLNSGLAKVLYVCILAAFSAAAFFVYRMGGFAEKAVCLMVFLGLSAGMAFISGLAKQHVS